MSNKTNTMVVVLLHRSSMPKPRMICRPPLVVATALGFRHCGYSDQDCQHIPGSSKNLTAIDGLLRNPEPRWSRPVKQ